MLSALYAHYPTGGSPPAPVTKRSGCGISQPGWRSPCLETDAAVQCLIILSAACFVAGDDLGRLHWLQLVD